MPFSMVWRMVSRHQNIYLQIEDCPNQAWYAKGDVDMIHFHGTTAKGSGYPHESPVREGMHGHGGDDLSEGFFREGEQFLRTASAGWRRRRDVFTPSIIYNLTAMAIERFIMFALVRFGLMPDNHTMYDLVNAMEEHFPGLLGETGEELLWMGGFQEICSLSIFKISSPAAEDIPRMIDAAARVRELVCDVCSARSCPGRHDCRNAPWAQRGNKKRIS